MALIQPTMASFSTFTDMVNRFRTSSAKLDKTMEQLLGMKSENIKTKELTTEAALLILDLKAASRSIHMKVDSFREHVQDYKNKLDASQLQLENLLYRKQHLVRELTLCHDFTIREVEKVEKDEGIEIVTNNDDLSSTEPHKKRLKLLTEELSSRSLLEEELKQLSEKRQKLEESIDDNKTFLVGLPEQLKSIQGASQVLQRHFKLPGGEKREQHERAVNLSEPLYVLYRQLDTLCGPDNRMKVTIEDAEPFQKQPQSQPTSQRKSSKKSAEQDGGDKEEVDEAFNVEDLAIMFTIHVEVDENVSIPVKLRLQRLIQFNTITVECEDFDNTAFVNLFPGDTGQDFPNTCSQYLYEQSSSQQSIVYPKEAPARPFIWAQWLSGLNSLPASNTNSTSCLASSSRMVIQRLHTRVIAYSILKRQLSTLSSPNGLSKITVHGSCESLFPSVHKSHYSALTKWNELNSNEETQALFGVTGEASSALFFAASFKTKKGTQDAHVMVTSSYPEIAPRWLLKHPTNKSGETVFDQDLKDLEVELNAHYDELVNEEVAASWNWLLFHQITRLQMGLGSVEELKSLSFHTHTSTTLRGRNRRRPIAYSVSQQEFFHR